MDRKLPVLADINSGLDDIVFEGKTGRLINFKNASDLAEVIIDLEQDATKRQRMGVMAAERVDKLFSRSMQLDQFAKVL